MADQDDPKFRWPPVDRSARGRASDSPGEPDPLVELARIVSGAPQQDSTRRPAAPVESGRSTGRDLARDLEAELLENLQASFDAIRAPMEPQYPHDTTASEPEPQEPAYEEPAYEEPSYEPSAQTWEEPEVEEPAPPVFGRRFEGDYQRPEPEARYPEPEPEAPYAEDVESRYQDEAEPAARQDDSWAEAAVDPRSWAEQGAEWPRAEDHYAADFESEAEAPPRETPDRLFPSPADFDRELANLDEADRTEPGFDAGAEDEPYRPASSAPLRDRWGFSPLPPAEEAADVADDYAPPAVDPYAADERSDAAWREETPEPAFDFSHEPAAYEEDEQVAEDAQLFEDSEFGGLPGEREPRLTDDFDDDHRFPPSSDDGFDDDDDFDDRDPAAVPPPAYAGRGERLAVHERGAGGGRRVGRGLKVVATMLGVVLVGGVSAFALFGSSDDSDVLPPVIAANNDPFKVDPPKAATPDQEAGKLSYDRIVSADQANGQLSGAGSEPVLDVPPPPSPTEGSREISRIILPESGSNDSAMTPEPPAVEPRSSADDLAIQPRRVRTVVVKPDGTIVTNETDAPDSPAPTPQPPTVAETPRVNDNGPIPLTPPQPPAVPASEPAPTPPRVAANPAPPIPEIPRIPDPAPSGPSMVAEASPPPTAVPPVPQARPNTGTTVAVRQPDPPPAVATAPFPSSPAPQPVRPAPSAIASNTAVQAGDFVVQVSSQRSEEAAVATYRSLQSRFPSLLGSFEPAIQRADLGEKGVYYRVRVGPMASREDAVAFCEQYRAAGGDCIVAKN